MLCKYIQIPAVHEHPNSRTWVFSIGRFSSLLAAVVHHRLRPWLESRAGLSQPMASAVDVDGLHMVQQPVRYRGGEDLIAREDL